MAYAIIRTGGKQFRVEKDATVRVPSIADKKDGETVEFEVLAMTGDDGLKVGSGIGDAKVTGIVIGHARGAKIIVFKKKRRKQYKRRQGHRQGYTAVKIDSIG